jgi:hypothetical protein
MADLLGSMLPAGYSAPEVQGILGGDLLGAECGNGTNPVADCSPGSKPISACATGGTPPPPPPPPPGCGVGMNIV